MEHGKRLSKPTGTPRKWPKIGAMDLILIIVGISILLFTLKMIDVFEKQGAVPDTLITCFFATVGGECGIMGWIKTNKDRHRERQWEKEDKRGEIPPGDT